MAAMQQQQQQQIPRGWTYGLCDCFGDCGTCTGVFFCPCFMAGELGKNIGQGYCGYCFCAFCCPHCTYWVVRRDVRERFNIEGDCFEDCMCCLCCGCCSLIQQYREMKVHVLGVGPQRQTMNLPPSGAYIPQGSAPRTPQLMQQQPQLMQQQPQGTTTGDTAQPTNTTSTAMTSPTSAPEGVPPPPPAYSS